MAILPAMGHRTPLYAEVEAKLGEPLREYAARRRSTAPPTSWRVIALEIRDQTGADITGEALRMWLKVLAPESERVA